MPAEKGYVYILTNPSFPEYVKIESIHSFFNIVRIPNLYIFRKRGVGKDIDYTCFVHHFFSLYAFFLPFQLNVM